MAAWTAVDDELMQEWGFEAVVLHERPAGFAADETKAGYTEPALSIAVFDAAFVQVVDFTPKDDLLKRLHL